MTSYSITRVYDSMTTEWIVSFNVYRTTPGGIVKRKRYLQDTIGM